MSAPRRTPGSQRSSRESSTAPPSISQQDASSSHAPLVPSRLWQAHAPGGSPESLNLRSDQGGEFGSEGYRPESTREPPVNFVEDGIHPPAKITNSNQGKSTEHEVEAIIAEPEFDNEDAQDSLLDVYNRIHVCEDEHCDHGTLSPRAPTAQSTRSGTPNQQTYNGTGFGGRINNFEDAVSRNLFRRRGPGRKSTTQWLASKYGIKNPKTMYLNYYFPFSNWISQYKWSFLRGDLASALTMASFYIPMALSYSSNLAHLPPINGLYSFVFNPLIYAFLGTCPQMVVGPEAAGSLLVGNVVRTSVDSGRSGEDDDIMNARIAGVVTGMAGAIIFASGLSRLGFLDSILSKPFLRGFISAIGFVILVDQLIPEMGLADLAKEAGVDHESSWVKLVFLAKNAGSAHALTCWISLISFTIIMVCRTLKSRWQPRYPSVAFIPDRFVVVVLSAVLAYSLDWEKHGVELLGEVKSSTGSAFPFHWPFVPAHMKHVREAMSTSFLIALLGFFESSVAAKALGSGGNKQGDGIKGISLSANRELIALGVANLVGGCFMALPAFGGYGRSKVNASTGGKTPMSSIFLSIITILSVLFLLPYFYYLPKGVLSAMVTVVAYSLIEECPHDIRFFIKIRGWSELSLMFLIFAATILYSLPLGIALGMGLSLLSVIRHATKPRIQILGKVPGSVNNFENAEENPRDVEFIEGCLIVKIPEPLTFANTGDLKNRLRRLELYGTTAAHPALPRVRAEEHNKNIIFDVHGVTGLDGSGAQVLTEIVEEYVDAGARVFFCRVPTPRNPVFKLFVKSGIVEKCGGMRHFVKSFDEALKLAMEPEDLAQFRDQEDPPV